MAQTHQLNETPARTPPVLHIRRNRLEKIRPGATQQQGRRIPIGQAAGGGGQPFGAGKENTSETGEGEKARKAGDRTGKAATGADTK